MFADVLCGSVSGRFRPAGRSDVDLQHASTIDLIRWTENTFYLKLIIMVDSKFFMDKLVLLCSPVPFLDLPFFPFIERELLFRFSYEYKWCFFGCRNAAFTRTNPTFRSVVFVQGSFKIKQFEAVCTSAGFSLVAVDEAAAGLMSRVCWLCKYCLHFRAASCSTTPQHSTHRWYHMNTPRLQIHCFI